MEEESIYAISYTGEDYCIEALEVAFTSNAFSSNNSYRAPLTQATYSDLIPSSFAFSRWLPSFPFFSIQVRHVI